MISVGLASILMFLKIYYSSETASLSLLASGLDSFFDILASSINLYAIKEMAKPADKEHLYGHGKVESLAGLFQSTVIFLSGCIILYQGLHLAAGTATIHDVQHNVSVMIFSSICSILITLRLRYVGKKYSSNILLNDSLHYISDVYQNVGILIAMIAIYFTGFKLIDAVSAIIVSIVICYSAGKIFIQSINCLMDRALPDNIHRQIIKTIMSTEEVKSYHLLRTRRAGNTYFIDVHIVLPPKITLAKSHSITDKVERALLKVYPNAQILIHPDPYDDSVTNKYQNTIK